MIKRKDSVGVYLEEIGRIKMLTASEEITLARLVADLSKLEELRLDFQAKMQRLPTELEWAEKAGITVKQLRQRQFSGRAAKDKIVTANLRLVVSIAKKFVNRGLHIQDLIQEGSLGLIRAAEKFAPERGYKFSTYATWLIRGKICRAVNIQSRLIRLPVNFLTIINQLKKTWFNLTLSLKRHPTAQEIADEMEIPIERLRFILKNTYKIDSLDRLVGEQENTILGDLISQQDNSLEVELLDNCFKSDLNLVLNELSIQEAEVLRLHYGLDDGVERTLSTVARQLNFSRERISQIKASALRKLKKPERSKFIKEYLA